MRPNIFTPLLTIIAAALCLTMHAQTPDATDDPHQAPILQGLSEPGSSVTINAPEALLQRAFPVAEETDNNPALSDEEATDEAEKASSSRQKAGKTAGYRVQVYADNNARSAKTEARQRERAISQAFPAYATYVSYVSPYWRLRVGDFHSTYEAEKAAAEIRRAFPRYAREVRVVRDHVTAR